MMVNEIEELFEPKFPITLSRLNRLEKENREMMIHEFEKLTGIQIAPECWDRIEYVYMNCDQFQTKDQIADYYKKHDMNGIEKLYKELKEKEQAHHYILKINAGKYGFEYRSADIYKIRITFCIIYSQKFFSISILLIKRVTSSSLNLINSSSIVDNASLFP